MSRYYFNKEDINLNDIEYICIHFDNNEYISILKNEILDYEFEYQDKLTCYRNGIYPVVNKGYINFKINKYCSFDSFIYDTEKFNKNRKQFIFDRCVEGRIIALNFFNSDGWGMMIFGNFIPTFDDERMSFEILDKENKNYSSTMSIDLPVLNKDNTQSISLDFENCESIQLRNSDIEDINIKTSEYLNIGSSYLERIVIGGYIKIDFNTMLKYRNGILLNEEKSNITIEEAINKIFEDKEHCIINLYITYNRPGYGDFYEEKLYIKDIRYEDITQTGDEEIGEKFFIGGHVDKEDDVITITFE